MNVLYSTKRLSYLLISTLALLILSACSTGPSSPDDTPPELFSELNNNSAFYLNKDKLEDDQDNSTWQFIALQALIEEQQLTLADSIIEHLKSKELTPQEQTSLQLLIAQNSFAKNEVESAQRILISLDTTQLSTLANIAYLKLHSDIYIAQEKPLLASDTLLVLTPLLITDQDKQTYNDILLTQLSLLPTETLNQYQKVIITEQIDTQSQPVLTETEQAEAEIVVEEQPTIATEIVEELTPTEQFKQGWYALAAVYQGYKLRPNHLKRAVDQWVELNPEHAVLAFMPTQLSNLSEFSPYQPKHIAVVIPLTGRFQQQGKAIKYGLLDAFYRQQQANKQSRDEDILTVSPKLYFYDTNNQTAEEIAAQLQQQKIEFIIGPLLKKNVETFLPLVENIPTLALNRFAAEPIPLTPETTETAEQTIEPAINEQDNDQVLVNEELVEEEAIKAENEALAIHYAFSLSPEDEAKQAALLIAQNQHKKPLIIAPSSSYGKRVANAFTEQWSLLNTPADTQVEQHFFKNKAQLAKFIEQVLHTDKSKRRIKQMQAITDVPLKTEVRSRRDIDAIYLVSKRDELILLKPFIDVSTSPFATKIPLYASSRTHATDRSGKQNNELNNLTFSDMPFMLEQQGDIRNDVKKVMPNKTFTTQRLFALGFDSYQLIEQLIQLQISDSYSYQGMAGELSLDSSNTIHPKLSWAKYHQGKLIEVASPITAE